MTTPHTKAELVVFLNSSWRWLRCHLFFPMADSDFGKIGGEPCQTNRDSDNTGCETHLP